MKHVVAVSTIADEGEFWSRLKQAYSKLPEGAQWKLAVAAEDGTAAVNIIVGDSIETVRDFFESHAAAFATTEYFEADAANAIGLPR